MATPTTGDEHSPDSPPKITDGVDFEMAQRNVFAEAEIDVQSRFVDLANPQVRTHVIEAGKPDDDPPVLFVHGTTWFGAYFAPLLAELDGRRLLALDRPGWGLSGTVRYTPTSIRQTASNVVLGVLDELGIEQIDLVGNSTGGFWSIAFALTHPDRVHRLILLGGVATFPGAQTPLPTRLLTIPGLNRVLSRLQKPSKESVVKQMEGVGDGDAILEYPALIQAKVDHDRMPRTSGVSVRELRTMITVRGWRSGSRLRVEELRNLHHPAMFIWGEHDWFGGPDKIRKTVETMPDARLEPIDAGHAPWFGHPEKCARLIREMRT